MFQIQIMLKSIYLHIYRIHRNRFHCKHTKFQFCSCKICLEIGNMQEKNGLRLIRFQHAEQQINSNLDSTGQHLVAYLKSDGYDAL